MAPVDDVDPDGTIAERNSYRGRQSAAGRQKPGRPADRHEWSTEVTADENSAMQLQQATAAAEAVAPLVESMEEATGIDLSDLARHDAVLARLGWDYVELLAVAEEAAERAANFSYQQADPIEELRCQGLCRRANAVLGQVAATIDARLLALSTSLVTAGRGSDEHPPDAGSGRRSDNC